jgi:hypothetical protein
MRQWVIIRVKSVAKLIIWLCLLGVAHYGLADSERLQRYNEAQNLDLKIRQQQTLRQEPFSVRPQLKKRFDRQRAQQQHLQSRQLRQIPKAHLPSTTGKPTVKESARRSSIERFKREQKSQALGFKKERAQSVSESEPFKQNRSPPFQPFFEER